MKIGLNFNADSINVLALNMGRIAVDVDGIDIAELMDAVNTQGLTLRIAEKTWQGDCRNLIACRLPPDWRMLQHSPYHQRG